MLSEEKIKIMTNLAMFEKREGRRIFSAGRYFKGDYVSSKLFRSFFSYTFSFLICLVLWGLYHMEQWLKTMDLRTVTGAGVKIGVVYGIRAGDLYGNQHFCICEAVRICQPRDESISV